MKDRFMWRSRWAALGAAIAVSLGGGGALLTHAAPGPNESTVVAVTPQRVLDTRDPTNLGLSGPFVSQVSQKLQITGNVAVASGGPTTVVPDGATGVLMNVTAVSPTADGFVSIRPGNATGTPSTSSLNVEGGSIVPNSVQVALPTSGGNAGKIEITFDAYGIPGHTTDLLIDIVGYTTSSGLQELVRDIPVVEFAGGQQFISVGTSATVVRSVTITPPSNGTVAVTSAAGAVVDSDSVQCSLTTGTSIDGAYNQIEDGAAAGDRVSLAGVRAFDAAANSPLTVNLVCRSGSANIDVFDSAMTAEFFPTDGVAPLMVPEPSASPEETPPGS